MAAAATSDPALEACQNRTVSPVDVAGQAVPAAQVVLMEKQVADYCNSGGSTEETRNRSRAAYSGHVSAYITANPGDMRISGYAAGLPNVGHEISCTYKKSGGSWMSCGHGVGQTFLSTSTVKFCPVKGTSWTAIATVYRNGAAKISDSTTKFAV
ncbi:hypothetical protein [Pseudoclavibacter sp. 8L]|uniref:hypothetical protein n=1 Tax=Pseudoclavibacter sp. 8L TaxID=2653162 RepID=UPI00135BB491|nr:hypothetical protein [Pseudoclavibacter sp. 8L]